MSFKETFTINLTELELLEIYHRFPKILSKFSTKVTIQEDSLRKSNQEPILLNQANNGNYWLIATSDNNYYCLLPKNNLRINPFEYPTVKALFDLENYQAETTVYFTLTKLGKVSLSLNGQDWILEAKGKLEFSQTSESQLEKELQQSQERYQFLEEQFENARSQLKKAEEQSQILKSRLTQSEEERQQLLSSLQQLAQTHQQSLSQLANWDELLKYNQQALEEHDLLQSKVQEFNQGFNNLKSRVDAIEQNLQFNSINQSESSSNSLEDMTKLIELYNTNPDYFAKNAIEVSETKDSFKNRHVGDNQPLILGKNSRNRGFGWIIYFGNNYYLVPKPNLEINEINYQLIQAFFDSQNYHSEYLYSILLKAARVSPLGENWQLIEKGELKFEQEINPSQSKNTKNMIENLVKLYNKNPNSFIEVSVIEPNSYQRRLGYDQVVIGKVPKGKGSFCVLLESDYLLVKPGIKIDAENYQAVQALFICHNYQRENINFELVKPAKIASLSEGETWQIMEKGELLFS